MEWGTSKNGQWSTGFSRLGIVGNVIGTVPAIANDIEGGMDPTKAVVSETAGTAAGMAVGNWATSAATGAMVGSVAPGVGTAVGFVVGAGIGALTAYGVSKSIQWVW